MLNWACFSGAKTADLPSVDEQGPCEITTSGRAALFQALKRLHLARGSVVLVPTYHCPTMVAPIVHAGLTPVFYAIGEDGLPQLHSIQIEASFKPQAMIVAHYFGIAQSLRKVREWCDQHAVALVEDCAHTFFGTAGERPVGAWGDIATASVTKFFAVPEAGLLVSKQHNIAAMAQSRQSALAECKGAARLLLAAFHALPSQRPQIVIKQAAELTTAFANSQVDVRQSAHRAAETDPLQGCDMSRADLAPLVAARAALSWSHRQHIVAKRRTNHERMRQLLDALPGTKILFNEVALGAPYALPLWVQEANWVYHGLRSCGFPVFRWDYTWNGTPTIAGDCGPEWSHHVLQLLCHQDLSVAEVEAMAACARSLVLDSPAVVT